MLLELLLNFVIIFVLMIIVVRSTRKLEARKYGVIIDDQRRTPNPDAVLASH